MYNIVLIDRCGNHKKVETFTFPGGEVQVRLPDIPHSDGEKLGIQALVKNSEDLMTVFMIKDAIDREVIGAKVDLYLHYLPYARQDRVCSPREALGVAVVAKLINACEFSSVFLYDPHSDVGPALINNCRIITQDTLFRQKYPWMRKYHNATLVSPDAGASKKIMKLTPIFNNREFIQAHKVRDMLTGDIIETCITASPDMIEGKDCLIVDDICDGGRTFLELAKVLKESGAKNIGLYVTHGIFSKGKDVLKEYIDDIYAHFDWEDYNAIM